MSDKRETTPTIGRAFNAAVGADWMITEDGLRTLLTIAARLPVNRAVEAEDSPHLEYTRECTVRHGVAIIPVDGPIFRYANWFTYFSGGSSVDVLAKDLNAALSDPAVHAIMFEINSPGGEVTGINEFTEMIYEARSRKPMTARVGGLGCSAAYWIASACGDVVVDETAMLGSIGVMAVYVDDRKQLEMSGIEEIEFISSQSPFKNSPAHSDEGRKRIQRRIDALAQVFVDKVARNRGVSVDTVMKEFGQGDVFVGQTAIAAGLADRLGSFESSLHDLARTHNPYFVDQTASAEAASVSDEKTIKESVAVSSESVETDEGVTAHTEPENLINNGEIMADENKDQQNAAEQKESAPAGNAAAAPATAPATAAADGGTPAPQPASAKDELADLRAAFQKSENQRAEAEQKIAALEDAALDTWVQEQVKDLAGETASHTSLLTTLVKAHGKESAEVTGYLTNQKALTAQIEAGGLFGEIGKAGAGTDNTAENKLEKLAKERAVADKISFEQAYTLVLGENKELAKEVV